MYERIVDGFGTPAEDETIFISDTEHRQATWRGKPEQCRVITGLFMADFDSLTDYEVWWEERFGPINRCEVEGSLPWLVLYKHPWTDNKWRCVIPLEYVIVEGRD